MGLLGLLWTVLLVVTGPIPSTDLASVLGAFGVGVINAAAGAAVSHLVRQIVLAASKSHRRA